MLAVCYAAYILFKAHRKDAVCVLQSTGTVQLQAHPTMLWHLSSSLHGQKNWAYPLSANGSYMGGIGGS